jgi:hypothetical protein
MPSFIWPSIERNLSEFVNPTKTVFTNAILSLDAAIYRQGERCEVSAESVCIMDEKQTSRGRRTFRWSKEARELVRIHLNAQRAQSHGQDSGHELRVLVTKLVRVSGNPRDACSRFARQAGVSGKRAYGQWPERAQQRLLDLIAVQPLPEVAIAMRRSPGSIRSMLYRLGASARMGQDWFTKNTLAEALHVRPEEVQRWITLGWLKCRVVQTGKLQRGIIDADDFSEFCRAHSGEVVGRRLNIDRLNFVKDFVFPPSHAELLPVRESKKERAAYDEQMSKPSHSDIDDEQYDDGLATTA